MHFKCDIIRNAVQICHYFLVYYTVYVIYNGKENILSVLRCVNHSHLSCLYDMGTRYIHFIRLVDVRMFLLLGKKKL